MRTLKKRCCGSGSCEAKGSRRRAKGNELPRGSKRHYVEIEVHYKSDKWSNMSNRLTFHFVVNKSINEYDSNCHLVILDNR